MVDGCGLPLVVLVTPGQAGDAPALPRLLAELKIYREGPGRPRTTPDALRGDKAYGVILEQTAGQVRLWEPNHGEVLATSRNAQYRYSVGTRAYASAGLPGADWWVESPVGSVEDADVVMDQVYEFYAAHDLWSRLN